MARAGNVYAATKRMINEVEIFPEDASITRLAGAMRFEQNEESPWTGELQALRGLVNPKVHCPEIDYP